MEILKGTVSKLRSSIEIDGTDQSTATTQVASFQLGSRSVMLRSADPASINEGDSVSVVGTIKNGLFKAFAYRNETTGVSSDLSTLAALVGGWLFSVSGAAGVLGYTFVGIKNRFPGAFVGAAIFGLLVAAGYWAFRSLHRTRKARALLGI